MVKSPVISLLPPAIPPGEVTPGAEYTISSKTIAICDEFLFAFLVISSQILAPLPFICIETAALLNWS